MTVFYFIQIWIAGYLSLFCDFIFFPFTVSSVNFSVFCSRSFSPFPSSMSILNDACIAPGWPQAGNPTYLRLPTVMCSTCSSGTGGEGMQERVQTWIFSSSPFPFLLFISRPEFPNVNYTEQRPVHRIKHKNNNHCHV